MANVSVRSSNFGTLQAGSTAASVTAPTGTAAGDVVICIVAANGTATTMADNNGSTPFTKDLSEETEVSHTVSVFSRRIVTGDPSTYAFTLGSSQRWSVVAVTFKDPDPSTIYDVLPSVGKNASTTSQDAPSITTTTANAIHCAVGTDDGLGSPFASTPSGYTVEQNTDTDMRIAFTDKTIATPSATGAQTFTVSVSNAIIAISFAIKSTLTNWRGTAWTGHPKAAYPTDGAIR